MTQKLKITIVENGITRDVTQTEYIAAMILATSEVRDKVCKSQEYGCSSCELDVTGICSTVNDDYLRKNILKTNKILYEVVDE